MFVLLGICIEIQLFPRVQLQLTFSYSTKLNTGNIMDSSAKIQPMGIPRPGQHNIGPFPQGNLSMMPMARPMHPMHQMHQMNMNQQFPGFAPFQNMMENQRKKKQFACGIYVSGFEKTLTVTMLQEYFKLKPIEGIKLPLTKFSENKGFAFIYYKSEDDAQYVKKKLDHTIILKNKIRVTRIVVADHLSRMMFKMNNQKLNQEQIKNIQKIFFNQECLQKAAQKIIERELQDWIQINKVSVPKQASSTPLKYARVLFHVNDLKQASKYIRSKMQNQERTQNDFELVLAYIEKILNQDEEFKKYAKAEIYEYAKNNKSTILHFKGIKQNEGQNPQAMAEEFKTFILEQNKQATVKYSYVGVSKKREAWANVAFSSPLQAQAVYTHFKNNRIKFRQNWIYCSMKNIKDNRTVVISKVKKDVTDAQMRSFLDDIARKSNKLEMNDENGGRKFDYFSFNIIEEKTFYIDENNISVGIENKNQAVKTWRLNNTVPRRVIIHFMNDIYQQDLHNLINTIKINDQKQLIFVKDEKVKSALTANHQKGHIQENRYVRHFEQGGKKKKQPHQRRQNNPNRMFNNRQPGARRNEAGNNPNYMDQFNKPKGPLGYPNIARVNIDGKNMPIGRAPPTGYLPRPQMGGINNQGKTGMPMNLQFKPGGMPPMMGQTMPPMGQQPPPPMGQKQYQPAPNQGQKYQPQMGQPQMGQPQMGQSQAGKNSVMGSMMMPQMGQPQMGKPQQPPMGKPQQPQMGQSKPQ